MSQVHLRQVLVYLRAGQWTEAHNLVQQDDSPLAAWLHGILHLQEGDLECRVLVRQGQPAFPQTRTLTEELQRFEAALPLTS